MVSKYSASDLRHIIEFLQLVKTPDGMGGKTEQHLSFSPPRFDKAMIRPRSSFERYRADQITTTETTLIVIRFRPGIDQTMAVQSGTRRFQIRGIVDDQQEHLWLELDCEERYGE